MLQVLTTTLCFADAAASQQEFDAQLMELKQQSETAVNARPTAEQYNQVDCVHLLLHKPTGSAFMILLGLL